MKSKVVLFNNSQVTLNDSDVIGGGGEGEVFCKNGYAIKLYHDLNKALPLAKIRELEVLKDIPNVLGPQYPVYSRSSELVGFAMPYVSGLDYFVKLFNKAYKLQNQVSLYDLARIGEKMRATFEAIHARGCLIVDANEMNFLIQRDLGQVFFIDVDSYQTKTYRATAIMDSIRDRKVVNNNFTQFSDWFSYAVLLSQVFLNTHPYKCIHPDYKRSEWQKMMDDSVSIFNPKSKMPPNSEDLSVLPQAWRHWLERVLEHGERTVPPSCSSGVPSIAQAPTPKTVFSNETFSLQEVFSLSEDIEAHDFFNNASIGKSGFYKNGIKIRNKVQNWKNHLLRSQDGGLIIVEYSAASAILKISDSAGNEICKFETNSYFCGENKVYWTASGFFWSVSINKFGEKYAPNISKLISSTVSTQFFDGFASMIFFDKFVFAIPTEKGIVTLQIKDPSPPCRILSGVRRGNFLVLISEKNGAYFRHLICVENEKVNYFETLPLQDFEEANLARLDNGIFASQTEDSIEIFSSPWKRKKIANSPLRNGESIFAYGNGVYFLSEKKVIKLSIK